MKSPLKLALATLLSLAPLTARADIMPHDVELCSGKAVGDACGDNGRCAESSCSRATPDGMVSYSCMKCVEAAVEPTPTTPPASEKKNCSSAPEGMALGLLALVGFAARARRRRA